MYPNTAEHVPAMHRPIPDNDRERLAALEAYDVADTPPEMDFDEIAEVAAQICDCPVAVVNIVAENWEWYKGKCGIPDHVNNEPRGGICSSSICSNDLLIVPDLSKDERFVDQEIVKGPPHFRFYAGAPLINPEGYALGTLCVLDHTPRELDSRQVEALRALSHQALMQLELRRKVSELEETRRTLAEEKQKSDDLLGHILPQSIAEELKASGKVQPRYHDAVTILFTDFKHFTQLTGTIDPRTLIDELNDYFSAFDDIFARHGLEKLKTIGDAYMGAAGLLERTQTHAEDACAAALDIRDHMARVNARREKMGQPPWQIRIGLHTGGVIAGVIGKEKFNYDIWGDAVNVAALMETNAEPGQVLISESTFNQVTERFDTEFHGEIDTVKKKGRIRCHVLKGPN